MRIIILGARGMLGQELVRVATAAGYTTHTFDRDEIDVTDAAQDEKIFELVRAVDAADPAVIFNCVAYNNMDGAESVAGAAAAELLNATVPARLSALAKKCGATFVHFSTDCVFDGTQKNGYDESAAPAPVSAYGASKFHGEQAVQNSGANFYLVRLSRLFGRAASSPDAKKSFVDIMLDLARTKTELNLVDEECACPTYAPDLAAAVLALVTQGAPFGIYHLPNTGACTWYEFGKEIFARAVAAGKIARAPEIHAVPAAAFPRPAARPKFSELKNTKRPLLRPWHNALTEYISSL